MKNFLLKCRINVKNLDSIRKKKTPKRRTDIGSGKEDFQVFHCLPQKIPAVSSSDYDCFKIVREIDNKIGDFGFNLRKLVSDQQIVEKFLRFQKDGFFTHWIFDSGDLHILKMLEDYLLNNGFSFIFDDLAKSLPGYNYLDYKLKEIIQNAHFFILCCVSFGKYFDKIFHNSEYNSFKKKICFSRL